MRGWKFMPICTWKYRMKQELIPSGNRRKTRIVLWQPEWTRESFREVLVPQKNETVFAVRSDWLGIVFRWLQGLSLRLLRSLTGRSDKKFALPPFRLPVATEHE